MTSQPTTAARWYGPALFVVILVVDLITKQWALASLLGQPPITVTGFFNLVFVWNAGVSFGMFQAGGEAGRWFLVGVALAVSAVLVVWLRRETRLVPRLAIWLILAGALGNIADRLRFGAVVDFLDFHAFGYHWPAFNIADSAIVVGAGLLVIDSLFGSRSPLSVEGEKKK